MSSRRSKIAKTARNLAIADAALAMARDRMGTKPKRRSRGKLLLLGGAAAAVAAGVLAKRDKVAGLLPSRSSEPGGWEQTPPPPPAPANYDAPGPVANTATPVPAPDPQEPGAIDERAEEAAAAAEAANIGGQVSDYAGTEPGLPASEEERPLAEAGEGEAEGQEQTEAGLVEAAEPTAPGVSDAERQIEDTIEQAARPAEGETPEPTEPLASPEAAEPAPEETPPQEEPPKEDSGSDWQTWSGRSINP
jgi:hypothetical protein